MAHSWPPALTGALLAIWLVFAAGCNTMEGFGKDVEATGEAISDTADDNGG